MIKSPKNLRSFATQFQLASAGNKQILTCILITSFKHSAFDVMPVPAIKSNLSYECINT